MTTFQADPRWFIVQPQSFLDEIKRKIEYEGETVWKSASYSSNTYYCLAKDRTIRTIVSFPPKTGATFSLGDIWNWITGKK